MSHRRADPKLKPSSKRGIPDWAIALGIGVAVVVGVVALFTLQTPAAPTGFPSGITAVGKTKGDPNAKLGFVVFSDFK